MTEETHSREEIFHDQWAASVDLDTVLVDESFESCTAPEGRKIVQLLGDVRGRSFLDLGCGLGEGAIYFAKKGACVTAADLSGGMLEVVDRLAKQCNVSVAIEKCAAGQTPFPDETFDIIYAGNLLHHVDIQATLIEVRRILKVGGIAVFWDPLNHNPLIKLYRELAKSVRTEDEHPLRMSQLSVFKQLFQTVKFDCFWFFTLWLFLRFFIVERVSPNQERYWKKIIVEHKRLHYIYSPLEKIDRFFLNRFPFLKRYCWNIVIHCVK
jgi:SAM-dependent methyltransferase